MILLLIIWLKKLRESKKINDDLNLLKYFLVLEKRKISSSKFDGPRKN